MENKVGLSVYMWYSFSRMIQYLHTYIWWPNKSNLSNFKEFWKLKDLYSNSQTLNENPQMPIGLTYFWGAFTCRDKIWSLHDLPFRNPFCSSAFLCVGLLFKCYTVLILRRLLYMLKHNTSKYPPVIEWESCIVVLAVNNVVNNTFKPHRRNFSKIKT